LAVVSTAVVIAPLLGELIRRFGVSLVVLELFIGVCIGPQGLALARPDGMIPSLANAGMAFLFFLAGFEIELEKLRGQPIQRAVLAWLGCFGAALLLAYIGYKAGLLESWPVVGLALATTSLGILVPVLKESGQLDDDFGRLVLAAGAMGELGPIVAMSLLLSGPNSTGVQTLLVLLFIATVVALGLALVRGVAEPVLFKALKRMMTQNSQLPIRLALFILTILVVLADEFDLDVALGALAAGMLIKFATRGSATPIFHHKLDGIGFGFLVPIFFVTSGMTLDLRSLFAGSGGLVLLACFLVGLLFTHAPFVLVSRKPLGIRNALSVGLYSATTLSLVVAMTQLAIKDGSMRASEASAIVVAGVISVLLFPALGTLVLRKRGKAITSYRRSDYDGL
jgi:Kef-type K+ transport system membrane component KefB